MMKVRDGGDAPGVSGQGACEETPCLIERMGYYRLDNFLGERCGSRRPCDRNLWEAVRGEQLRDPGRPRYRIRIVSNSITGVVNSKIIVKKALGSGPKNCLIVKM